MLTWSASDLTLVRVSIDLASAATNRVSIHSLSPVRTGSFPARPFSSLLCASDLAPRQLSHTVPCHPMPSQSIPCHLMPSHAIPCHPMPSHAVLSHAILSNPMPCFAIPSHPIPSNPMPFLTVPYHPIPCHSSLYHTIQSHSVPLHTIQSHTILCHTMLHSIGCGAEPGYHKFLRPQHRGAASVY